MRFGHVIQSAHVLAVHMFCTCNHSVYQMSAVMERKRKLTNVTLLLSN